MSPLTRENFFLWIVPPNDLCKFIRRLSVSFLSVLGSAVGSTLLCHFSAMRLGSTSACSAAVVVVPRGCNTPGGGGVHLRCNFSRLGLRIILRSVPVIVYLISASLRTSTYLSVGTRHGFVKPCGAYVPMSNPAIESVLGWIRKGTKVFQLDALANSSLRTG